MSRIVPEPDYFKRQKNIPSKEILFRIGNIAVLARTPEILNLYVSERMRVFTTDKNETPDLKVYVSIDASRQWFVNPKDTENPIKTVADNANEITITASHYCATLYDWKHREAHLVFASDAPEYMPTFELTTRNLVAHSAPFLGATFVHGSAIVKNNRAIVLLGPSGAGKSTTSHIACWLGGYRVLNDEILTLWREKETSVVAGTPFGATLVTKGSYPIKAFLRLSLSDKDLLTPMNKAQALSEVAASTLKKQIQNETNNVEDVLDLLELALKDVSCYKLLLKPGDGFINILERL